MRENLQPLLGQRLVVRATVRQLSRRLGWGTVRMPTILLGQVTAVDGANLCDHLWLDLGKRMACLDLKRGDVIEFSGRVRTYRRGMLRLPGEPLMYSLDYCLSYPTKVRKIAATQEGNAQ